MGKLRPDVMATVLVAFGVVAALVLFSGSFNATQDQNRLTKKHRQPSIHDVSWGDGEQLGFGGPAAASVLSSESEPLNAALTERSIHEVLWGDGEPTFAYPGGESLEEASELHQRYICELMKREIQLTGGRDKHPNARDLWHALPNTAITLLNATPYPWTMIYTHSYQMRNWSTLWPQTIPPGTTVRVQNQASLIKYCDPDDTAAEVTYQLEGTKKPAAFQIQFRSGKHHSIWVQFRDELESLHNAKNTEHQIGWNLYPGGVGFVLAGLEGDFLSMDGPLDWMQKSLPEIGHLSLREIIMPRSHHAGMYKNYGNFGWTSWEAERTQWTPIYHQLGNGGVRVIHLDPVWTAETFHAGMTRKSAQRWAGARGDRLESMILEVNKFMADYPGELYIWDVDEGKHWKDEKHVRDLNADDLAALAKLLKGLHSRVSVPDFIENNRAKTNDSDDHDSKKYQRYMDLIKSGDVSSLLDGTAGDIHPDLTRYPLDAYINTTMYAEGRSAVLIRVPDRWMAQWNDFHMTDGFVPRSAFPVNVHESDTSAPTFLRDDQAMWLRRQRESPQNALYDLSWWLAPRGADKTFGYRRDLAQVPWALMYQDLWRMFSTESYPSWLTLEFVRGNELKAFCMVINKCLIAKKCGVLGGKVKPPPPPDDPGTFHWPELRAIAPGRW